MSIQLREKFELGKVSKYGGWTIPAGHRIRPNRVDGKATMAVVTLVLAIDGDSTYSPKIRSMRDVEADCFGY